VSSAGFERADTGKRAAAFDPRFRPNGVDVQRWESSVTVIRRVSNAY